MSKESTEEAPSSAADEPLERPDDARTAHDDARTAHDDARTAHDDAQLPLDPDALEDEDGAWAAPRAPESRERGNPYLRVALVVAVVAGAMSFAFRPSFRGTEAPWFIMAGAYVVLAGLALFDLAKQGTLTQRFRIRPGDTSVGIVVGLVLCAGGILGQHLLAGQGSTGAVWLVSIYLMAGDFQTNGLLIFVLFLLAVCEETVWRGMVQDAFTRVRPRAAPAMTATAYALSTAPSLFLLADSGSLNPLLFFSALGCGLVWSYARRAVPRLFPIIVSHMVFTYFMAAPLPSWMTPGG